MAKRNFEEERASLLAYEENLDVSHRHCYPTFHSEVVRGVSNQVGKWPSHLFAAFLAASLVFAAFILFAVVTTLFCIPTAKYGCRKVRDVDVKEFPNVYFVKHTNRTWSRAELCYVESSVRDNPDVNVYLINLLADLSDRNNLFRMSNPSHANFLNERETRAVLSYAEIANNSIDLSPNVTEEAKTRWQLGERYSNVRNVDVTMQDFFKGSMLANVFDKLDLKNLEIAAKANIVWNAPGIALDPSNFRHISEAKLYLCKKSCNLVKNAAINPAGSFQASAVPCHAFFGYLMRQAAMNGVSVNRDIVKEARGKFCKSRRTCPGLEIHHDFLQVNQSLNCPTVYPSGISDSKMILFKSGGRGFWG